jgi:uncharacterized lipoprotein
MKKLIPLISLLFVLIIASCSRHHTSSVVYQKTARHRVVAVLPAEMIYTGTKPKNAKERMNILKSDQCKRRRPCQNGRSRKQNISAIPA